MIRDIFEFFKKEKGYTALFIIMAGVFVLMHTVVPRQVEDKTASGEALKTFKEQEKKAEKEIKKSGSFQAYLKMKDDPGLAFSFNLLSMILFTALIAGSVFNFILLFQPEKRRRLQVERPPPRTPWKVSMIFKVSLLFITGALLLGTLFALFQRINLGGLSANFWVLLHTTIVDIFVFVLIIYILRKEGGDWRDLGFRVPNGKPIREIFVGWGGYAALLPVFGAVLGVLVILAEILHYDPPAHPLVNVFLEEEKRAPFLIYYSLFLAIILGPVFEEIFFRGLCYQALRARFGVWPAIFLSASFFAAIHANSFAFVPIFILGVGLAWIFEKRGSLLTTMTVHLTHNVFFISYFFLAKKLIGME